MGDRTMAHYELRRKDGSLWKILAYLKLAQRVATRDSRLGGVGGLEIVHVDCDCEGCLGAGPVDPIEPTTNLIAAAPDLLSALITWRGFADNHPDRPNRL